jgi:glutamate-1-semialdehyde 2,1-aminomutase
MTSPTLGERALATTPGGVHSNVRLSGPKVFIERAKGAWMWDVDGKDYVDHLLGQGPNFLGHAPDFLIDAVAEGTRDGIIFGGQNSLEVVAAEAVLESIRWADLMRFASTGTEAVQAVTRLARAHTGRAKIVRFEGQYNGWLDNVLVKPDDSQPNDYQWVAASAGQVVSHLDDFIILPWNHTEAIDEAFRLHGDEIAAILTEPMMANSGAIVPEPGYLEHLRSVCDANGSVLIFDEVITGFRISLGGGAEQFGVTPDLATYGKAIAGGFPVAAFAGKAEIMERLASDTNHSGTLNANTMGSAATIASLNYLRTENPYPVVAQHGAALIESLPKIAADHGHQIVVHGLPAAFHVSFGAATITDWRSLQKMDLIAYQQFSHSLVDHGIWVTDRGIWYTSTAHGPDALDAALERFESAISIWKGPNT